MQHSCHISLKKEKKEKKRKEKKKNRGGVYSYLGPYNRAMNAAAVFPA